MPPSEAVSPERTVPVVVFRCDGSSGRPKTYGVEVHSQNDTTVVAVMAKAKQAAGVTQEPLGGVLWGRPKHHDSSLDRGISLLPPTATWDLQGSLVMVIPGVDEHCKTALELGSGKHDPRHQAARLVVYLQMLSDDARDERSVGPPIALIVTAEIAGGGRAAEKAVQQAVMRVLKPILKPGAQPPPAVFQHCMHCSEGGSLGYHQPVPFSQRGVLRSEFGMPTAYVAATVTDQARASYDLYKLAKPAAHPTAAPHVLAASRARHRESEKQRHAKDSAQSDPAAICREIIAAQRCSKPRQWGHSYISNGVHWQQDDIPTLRVRVHLEPDPQDPSQGIAVLQLWTWRSSMAPLATNEPGHKALIPPSPDYLEQWNVLRAHAMPRTMQRVLLHDVPGLAEAEAAVQRWSQPRRLDAIKSVPAMLKALETGEVEAATQPAGLTVTLRPYQLQTLGFMQRAESGEDGLRRHIWFPVRANAGAGGSGPESKAQQALWWWSPVYKTCCLQEPPRSCWGGFLGETMGLGKTVEVLALVLSRRYQGPPPEAVAPGGNGGECRERVDCVCGRYGNIGDSVDHYDDHYEGEWVQCDACNAWLHVRCLGLQKASQIRTETFECSRCIQRRATVEMRGISGATLIICPESILPQWAQEIEKHSVPGAVRLVVYRGQSQLQSYGAGLSGSLVTAVELAAADVVLTTYEVLRQELHYESDNVCSSRSLRTSKKYPVLPTPLTRLRWWRICLDEAQMVESSTAKAAEMALKLDGVHRWAVSGTPISHGLEDLFGLMMFLRVSPWGTARWWRRGLQEPCEAGSGAALNALAELLTPAAGGLMWRNSKRDVAEEIGIPPQHNHVTPLELSAVERHFYNRQHEQCKMSAYNLLKAAALDAEGAEEDSLRPLTTREEKKLLGPLLRLRQACCHPQVGSGGIRSLADAGGLKAPMTMDEILKVLITKAKVEAEESQRILMLALNGIAACMILQGQRREAVATYREALATAEENSPELHADSLQRLHALHNLGALLREGVPGVARTLRDGELGTQVEEIKAKYLLQWTSKLRSADTDYTETSRQAAWALAPRMPWQGWWLVALDGLAGGRGDEGGEAVVAAFRDHLGDAQGQAYRATAQQNASSITRRFTLVPGFKAVLTEELRAMQEHCHAALTSLEALRKECESPSAELVEQAGQCGQCREEALGVRGKVCRHCELDGLFLKWELRLFRLHSSSLQSGQSVSAEDVARQAQKAALFRVGRGGLNEEGGLQDSAAPLGHSRRDGTSNVSNTSVVRHPSEAEAALRWILGQLRSSGLDAGPRMKEAASLAAEHLKHMEAQRKLFLRARAVALAQRMLLYAHDELGMATMRLRLRFPGEQVKPHEELFKLHEEEVPARNVEFSRDKAAAAATLRSRLGTLHYLKTLETATAKPEAQLLEGDRDHCPVCQDVLGFSLVMFPCGHKMCCKCTMALVERVPKMVPKESQSISCPSCRGRVRVPEITYVNVQRPVLAASGSGEEKGPRAGGAEPPWEDAAVLPIGSYGTKLEAVVRRVLAILQRRPGAKILVFSSWADVLSLLLHALEANKVPTAYAHGGRSLQAEIARFRGATHSHPAAAAASPSIGRKGELHHQGGNPTDSSAHSVVWAGRRARGRAAGRAGADGPPASVLMLLTQQGANGLNLTEAQHVLLVEPLLDPAVEAQAIGRVHRIGQVHETWVHRFLATGTVEENVARLGAERASARDAAAAAVGKSKEAHRLTVRDMAILLDNHWDAPGEAGGRAAASGGA